MLHGGRIGLSEKVWLFCEFESLEHIGEMATTFGCPIQDEGNFLRQTDSFPSDRPRR
jgi:hypothetical protein